MILVLASEFDSSAQKLAEERHDKSAALLTPNHLCRSGWKAYLGNDVSYCLLTIQGRQVSHDDIDGVITRLPYVFEDELYGIIKEDRAYVAAEITSFLFYWLSTLKCPVINPPTPVCLLGPNWNYEQWLVFAYGIGIPVFPLSREEAAGMADDDKPDNTHLVTVIGEKTFGTADEICHSYALELAKKSGLKFVDMRFVIREGRFHLCGVNLLPDISSKEVRNRLFNYLSR